MFAAMPRLVPRSVLRATLKLARRWKFSPFEQQLTRASTVQRDWLIHRIRQCEATGFGRDHRFQTIRTLDDFRKQVPVSDYSYIATYINAVAAGDLGALIHDRDRLIQFTITTGSSGIPKLNPVTRTWLREYHFMEVWGIKLFTDHAQYIGSRILQMAGTWNMGQTVGGHQISMVSALLARTQSPLMKPFYALPEILNDVRDPVVRHYVALRLSILDDIGWIMLMNPGTLIRLAEIGDQHKETLIRDVFNGTLTDHFEIPQAIRTAIAPYIPHPRSRGSAGGLEVIENETGRLLPKDYWKQPVIGCWLGGTAGFQSRYLGEYFGRSPMRDMGLVSSEGRHTIPLEDSYAYGVPSLGAGYYEFIPIEESESRQPTVLEGHELSVGGDYRLVMTNSAGYYRFDIGDIVRCRSFVGQAPQLEFIQKNERVGDLEGEKLTEHQIVEGAHKAAAKLGINLGLLTGVPRRADRQKPWYDFLVTISEIRDSLLAKQFLTQLDQELAELNFLWRLSSQTKAFSQPLGFIGFPSKEAWDEYIQQELLRRGTGDYQYKHPGLVQDQGWLANFSPVDTICLET